MTGRDSQSGPELREVETRGQTGIALVLSESMVLSDPAAVMQVPFGLSPYTGSSPRKHKQSNALQSYKLQPQRLSTATTAQVGAGIQNNAVLDPLTSKLPSSHLHAHRGEEANVMDSFGIEPLEAQTKDDGIGDNPQHSREVTVLPSVTTLGQLPPTPTSPSNLAWSFQRLSNNASQQFDKHEHSIQVLSGQHQHFFTWLQQIGDRIEFLESENVLFRDQIFGEENARNAARAGLSFLGSRTLSNMEYTEHSRGDMPDSYLTAFNKNREAPPKKVHVWKPVAAESTKSKEGGVAAPEKNPAPNKRKVHNLTKLMPPESTILPKLPITDTELIVYFFNSLKRPQVSIRFSTRLWNPARIVEVLNDHRESEPVYLRNTCSVKLLTARRRGVKLWGEGWVNEFEEAMRRVLNDDKKATELLELSHDEYDAFEEVDALSLLQALKKHPTEGTGIFTECVKWCASTKTSWLLSDIHKLAALLQNQKTSEEIAQAIEDMDHEQA